MSPPASITSIPPRTGTGIAIAIALIVASAPSHARAQTTDESTANASKDDEDVQQPSTAQPTSPVRPIATQVETQGDDHPPEQAHESDLDQAPLPHEASGLLIPRDRSQYAWMWIPRAILFVPRWTLEVPLAMSRYGIWAYEHYDLRDRITDIFFNDDRTIGLYPTAAVESGFGTPKVGAGFVWRDIASRDASFHGRCGVQADGSVVVEEDVGNPVA